MRILSLDVGTKRIGVAYADSNVRIAIPREMIPVDGNENANIAKMCRLEKADVLVSGLPRNNQGEETKQSEVVRNFIAQLEDYFGTLEQKTPLIVFQDETLTSVVAEAQMAEKHHSLSRKERDAGILDSEAAALILQDFLEGNQLSKIEEEVNNANR